MVTWGDNQRDVLIHFTIVSFGDKSSKDTVLTIGGNSHWLVGCRSVTAPCVEEYRDCFGLFEVRCGRSESSSLYREEE